MKDGNNCCQSILLAAKRVWGIPIGDDILAAASLFGGGMGSGCTCGALAGMIMAAGIMDKNSCHPLGLKLAQQLHDRFKEEFGATCCRAIRKKQGAFHKIGNKACIELTAHTAQILVQELEEVLHAEQPAGYITDNTNPK
jgi:C_GCAxxG_C_C family probable redox protein